MRMIRAMLAILVVGLFVGLAPAVVQAVDPLAPGCQQGAQQSSICRQAAPSSNPLFGQDGIITRATQLVVTVVGVAAVIMIIVGGLKYILSSGDSSNTESAKNTILYAVIGLGIALVAQLIVLFVLRQL